ncbi:hypothetical protein HD806DRAFT_537579 [Xylariaceae sp. AK1471]|nr:hypothetical protein HD806DRAFT_537579 [Xylariaceae sp. AK1471]
MPIGLTSENVARRYGVSRADQDAFDAKIVPVSTRFQEVDKAGNKVGQKQQIITATRDETLQALAKLKPAFSANGSSTAGNSPTATALGFLGVLFRR